MRLKKIVMVLSCLISLTSAKAQISYTPCTSNRCTTNPPAGCELVCNGGFEIKGGDNNGLPTDITQVPKACGWNTYYTSFYSTPDFFYAGGVSTASVPCNMFGYEPERTTGSGYVGFFAAIPGGGGNYAEAVTSPLYSSLQSSKIYSFSCWVSLADGFGENSTNNVGFGVYDSSDPLNTLTTYTFDLTNVSRVGWTQITLTFTPTWGGENSIVVGSFLNIPIGATGPTSYSTCTGMTNAMGIYYFADDISIREISYDVTASYSPVNSCTGEPVTLTGSGANTYTWTGPNSYYATGTTATLTSPSSSEVYTVIGTTAGGCVSEPYTLTVATGSNCCMNANSNNVFFRDVNVVPYGTGGATAWSSITSGGFYSGNIAAPSNNIITNTLTVRGSFSISANVTFSMCNIAMAEDVTITQYSITTLDRCYLYGCDKMWTGINSRAALTITNTAIEDGYRAVNVGLYTPTLAAHPGLIVGNSCFNKDYIGIVVGTTSITPSNVKITGSVFTSRNLSAVYNFVTPLKFNTINLLGRVPVKLKGSTATGITANTIRTEYGVTFNTVTGTDATSYFYVGDVATTTSANAELTNYFDYVNRGVDNLCTKICVINNKFQQMAQLSWATPLGGVCHNDGPYNPGTTHTKVGSLGGGSYPTAHYKNTFYSSQDGVYAANGGTVDVSYNDFNLISRYGVNLRTWYAGTPANEPVLIANNSFTDVAYAVYAYDNNGISASITTNTVLNAASGYTAYYNVAIDEINKPAGASYSITANTFTGSLRGVNASNAKNIRAVNNSITVKKPSTTSVFNAGVWLDNCENSLVKGNTISCSPTNSGSWNTFGVFSAASPSNTVKCNTITKASACLKFQSNCTTTAVYYNSLNNTGGADPCLHGVWLDNACKLGDIGYNNGSQWEMSDDIWGDFNYAGGGSDTKCSASSNSLTTAHKIYYNDHGNAALYTPSVNIAPGFPDASLAFVPTINTNANSAGCGESARLMNPLVIGNAGSHNVKETSGRQFNSDNTELESTPKGWQQNFDPEVNTSPKKLILLSNSTNSSSNRVIGGDNEGDFNTVDSLFDVFKQTQNIGTLNSAKSLNSSINPDNSIEQNQKDFNGIYATYLEGDSMTLAGKITDLQSMAVLCPFTDGLAVYQARSLLRYWDDSTMYYNVCENTVPELSSNSSSRFASNSSIGSFEVGTLNLYPNPSNGTLMIEGSSKNSTFELYDIIGKKVFSSKLNENATQLELNSFNNGTYLFKITENGKVIKQDRLIISK